MARLALVLVLLLAMAFPAQAQSPQASSPAGQSGNAMHEQFLAMPDATRRAELFRFILSRGGTCQAITVIFFAGQDRARTAYWDSRCREGSAYRLTLSAAPRAQPLLMACGAASGGVSAGPCFRPIGTVVAPMPPSSGRGRPVASLPETGSSRFGAIYGGRGPAVAFGFVNGVADRVAAHAAASRACQAMGGQPNCRRLAEVTNACAALVLAVRRAPNVMTMTNDPATMVLVRHVTATGATAAAAEAAATRRCQGIAGATCRLAASGC